MLELIENFCMLITNAFTFHQFFSLMEIETLYAYPKELRNGKS